MLKSSNFGYGRAPLPARSVSKGFVSFPNLEFHKLYRESSQIQFTSHVLPPSGEYDCCIFAECGEMSNHS